MKLTRQDWVEAAFDAFERRGLDAVAVEPLARSLKATKGSFYWHFAGRDELIDAVLDCWRAQTEQIIEQVIDIEDPRERLRALFAEVLRHIEAGGGEVDLLGRTGPPSVVRARAQVSERRIAFMASALRDCGHTAAAARDRAIALYALWVGMIELAAAVPEVLPHGRGAQRLKRSTLELLDALT